MPRSRVRKKKVYTAPTGVRPAAVSTARRPRPSPRWIPGLAVALIFAGIAWLVTYYLSQGAYPVADLTYWNLAVGFGFMVASLGVLTQWR